SGCLHLSAILGKSGGGLRASRRTGCELDAKGGTRDESLGNRFSARAPRRILAALVYSGGGGRPLRPCDARQRPCALRKRPARGFSASSLSYPQRPAYRRSPWRLDRNGFPLHPTRTRRGATRSPRSAGRCCKLRRQKSVRLLFDGVGRRRGGQEGPTRLWP